MWCKPIGRDVWITDWQYESLRSAGWTVGSLIYDGMHVEHREGDTCDPATGRWMQLEAAMRAAENAAFAKTGYKIHLLEKPLFEDEPDYDEYEAGSELDA